MKKLSQLTTLQRTRVAIFAFYIVQGICFASWASRIPTIKTNLNLDDGIWGTVLLMLSLGTVVGMIFSGWVVARYGSRKILPISLLGHLITFLCIGVSNSLTTLILSLIGFGFTANFFNIALNTQGINIEHQYGKSIMATFHGGWSVAGFIGAVVGMLMIALNISPIVHFIIITVIVTIIYFTNRQYLQEDIHIEPEVDATGKQSKHKPEGFLFLLGTVAFFGMAAEGAMADWSSLYFQDIVGAPEKLVPLGFAAYMITMATTRFGIDKLTQRYGNKHVLQMSGWCIFAGLTLAVAYPNIVTTTIAFMIIGLGTSSIAPTTYSVAGQNTKIPSSMALMIVSSVGFLGYLMGPPVIGYISEHSNLRYSYALIGLFGLGIVILVNFIKVLSKDKK